MTVDVAVVGAGPAGAWAARELARRGARVTIFDPSHPREKPCGGGVTGRALAVLDGAIGRLAGSAVTSARFTDVGRGASAVVHLGERAIGAAWPLTVFDRMHFDAALLEAAQDAGAALVPERVSDLRVEASGAMLRTARACLRAGYVVGADGVNSLVRRRLAQPFRRDQLSVATGFFAHGVTSDEIVVEMTSEPAGYIWSFPRPDHLAIGICAQADAGAPVQSLRARTADWIRAAGIARGARLGAYSWPIPSLGARDLSALRVAGLRWLLVGDAAGLVDPITREGIFFALASGRWAADALSGPRPSRAYTEAVRREALPELSLAARLKAGFFRPAFARQIMRALQESAPIRAVMADLIAGRQTYAGLKWRLLGTFEWRLALTTLGIRRALER